MTKLRPYQRGAQAKFQQHRIAALQNAVEKLTLQRDAALRHLLDFELRNSGASIDRPEILPRPAGDPGGDLVLPHSRH